MVITKSGGALYYRPAGSTGDYSTLSDGTHTLTGSQDAYLQFSLPDHYGTAGESGYEHYTNQLSSLSVDNYSTSSQFASNVLYYTSYTSGKYTYYRYKIPLPLSDGYNYTISVSAPESNNTYYLNISVTSTPTDLDMPLGQSLVNGVIRSIKNGKCLVDGTSYVIKVGRVMCAGTVYDVGGTTPFVEPSAEDLFEDMVVEDIEGVNSSSGNRTGYTSYPTDEKTYYLFGLCNGYINVLKVIAGCPYAAPIVMQSGGGMTYSMTSTGGSYLVYLGSDELCYKPYTITAYGRTIAMVRFPHFTDAEVDACLSKAKFVTIDGRNEQTTAEVKTNIKNNNTLLISAQENSLDVRSGDNWSKISGTNTDASIIDGSYLSCGSVYGASIVQMVPKEVLDSLEFGVNITGTGDFSACYVTINGTRYYTATSGLTLTVLDSIGWTLAPGRLAASTVKFNGSTVASVPTGSDTTSGSFTIPYGQYSSMTIALSFGGSISASTIAITTT